MKHLLFSPLKAIAASVFENDMMSASGKPVMDPKTVTALLNNLQNIILGIAGVIILAVIIYGGVLYMTASGNDEKMQKAKKTITWGVIGLIIILLSGVLVTIFVNLLGGKVQ